jgi:hypothetical protein
VVTFEKAFQLLQIAAPNPTDFDDARDPLVFKHSIEGDAMDAEMIRRLLNADEAASLHSSGDQLL